jgi:hypothetical protein
VTQQPPPGSVPPGYPGEGRWGPGPAWTAPVHKPGVVPLRPLVLGDLFDGAFTTIRRNPGAMVGLAAAVTTAFLAVPVVVTLVLAGTGNLSDPMADVTSSTGSPAALELGSTLLSYLGTVFAALATVVLNGLLVRVVAEAVLGRRTTAGQAWSATRGRLLRLLGLTALNMLVVLALVGVPVGLGVLAGFSVGIAVGFLVGVPLLVLGVVALVFVQVRFFQLAAPALVLERTGVVASIRRAGRLSHGQFWRLFGIQLLTALVVGLVSEVITVPLSLLGVGGAALVPGTGGALLLVFASYVSEVVVGAVATPFNSAVVALQYVDQRIRKEGLDVQLIAASQQGAPPRTGQY